MSVLDLQHHDLRWLSRLSHAQMAAVRDVRMRFPSASARPARATASGMLFVLVCGHVSMLRQLQLDWRVLNEEDNLAEVGCTINWGWGCTVMPDMVCKACAVLFAGGEKRWNVLAGLGA